MNPPPREWDVILARHVWQFLSIRELGVLLCVNKCTRHELTINKRFLLRTIRFLKTGVKGIDFSLQHYYCQKLSRTRKRYCRLLEHVASGQPITVFPICNNNSNGDRHIRQFQGVPQAQKDNFTPIQDPW